MGGKETEDKHKESKKEQSDKEDLNTVTVSFVPRYSKHDFEFRNLIAGVSKIHERDGHRHWPSPPATCRASGLATCQLEDLAPENSGRASSDPCRRSSSAALSAEMSGMSLSDPEDAEARLRAADRHLQ